jgi:hypothetical protein
MLEGFLKISFLDFVYAIHIKNKLFFVVHDGMPMVSAIFHAREDLGSKPML